MVIPSFYSGNSRYFILAMYKSKIMYAILQNMNREKTVYINMMAFSKLQTIFSNPQQYTIKAQNNTSKPVLEES
jgi:hypothetical protein